MSSSPMEKALLADILWGVFTFYMWIPTLTINLALTLMFLFLWLAFFVLGAGDITGNASLRQLGGYIGFLTAGFAAYTSFAIVTNSVVGLGTVPLGPKILGKK